MTDNIKPFIKATAPHNENVITMLEEWLEDAKDGKIISVGLIGKRQWVGLTDEEVHQGFCHVEYETPNDWNTDPDDWCQQFARYLEAKLKEKNEAN